MTCTITGYLRAPDGSALPDTAVTIHLQKIAGTADGAAMPKEVTATSNGSGLLTLNLLPGIYRMRWQHDGICHYARLGVPDELSAVLGDLIDPAGMVVRGDKGPPGPPGPPGPEGPEGNLSPDDRALVEDAVAVGDRISLDAAEPIWSVQDDVGEPVMMVDAAGEVHVAGDSGMSLQRELRQTRDRLGLLSERIGHVASPALAALTDSQRGVYGFIDQLGEMYLPGLDDMSVQRRLRLQQRQLDELAGGGHSGSQGSTAVHMVDVVADLGCDRTGVEEVATRINAYTAGVEASRQRAIVYFPRGDYKVLSSILPRTGITFIGAGWGKAIIRPAASQAAFHRIAVSAPVEFANFYDLHIDGSEQTLNAGQYSVYCKGISVVANRYCNFIGNYIHDTGATALAPDFAYAGWMLRNRIERGGRLGTVGIAGSSGIGVGVGKWEREPCLIAANHVEDCRNYGIFLERQTNGYSNFYNCRGYIIAQNTVLGSNYGIGDCGAGELLIEGNAVEGATQAAIVLHGGTVNADPGQRAMIRGNVLSRSMDGIRFSATTLSQGEGFVSDGNQILLNSRDGIRIDTSAYVGTINNIASQNDVIRRNGGSAVNLLTGSSVSNFDIMSGRLIENTGAGIQLDGEVTGGAIFGNRIRDLRSSPAQTAAVAGTGSLTDVDIAENQYVGSGAADIHSGSRTRVTIGRNPGF